ncbi:MAG: DUF6468 domain-containing protein [Parvibaculum sp.]
MVPELPFDLLLEAIVCVLLLATIGYCAVIDRRLRAMRAGQDGLRILVRDLNTATDRAATAISQLSNANETTGRELGERVARARALADELGLMVEAGNGIADRLANYEGRRNVSPASPVQAQPAAGPRSAPAAPGRPLREAHQLLDALKRVR